jgi:hypothetical protein
VTHMVADLWVNHGLALDDILDAPPHVFGTAVRLINERTGQANTEQSYGKLHSMLRAG